MEGQLRSGEFNLKVVVETCANDNALVWVHVNGKQYAVSNVKMADDGCGIHIETLSHKAIQVLQKL